MYFKNFQLNAKKQKVADILKMLISGVIYQVVSDKDGYLASGVTEKDFDKFRKTKNLI